LTGRELFFPLATRSKQQRSRKNNNNEKDIAGVFEVAKENVTARVSKKAAETGFLPRGSLTQKGLKDGKQKKRVTQKGGGRRGKKVLRQEKKNQVM